MKVILLAVSVPLVFSVAFGAALRFIHTHSAKAHVQAKGTIR
jgi:hypothetical protein